jgi:hypothetical protein
VSRLLAAVTRATTRRTDADRAYRAAIHAAHQAGHTMEEIGRAAGITRQGVGYLLHPDPRKEHRG